MFSRTRSTWEGVFHAACHPTFTKSATDRERIYSADPVWFCAMKVKLAAATHASHSCTAVNLP